MKMSPATR